MKVVIYDKGANVMEIENGDYFVVSRGLRLSDDPFTVMFTNKNPQYDRSYDGLIFRAEDSNYPIVYCICIGNVSGFSINNTKSIGRPHIFNQYEVELMTLSRKFVEKCSVYNSQVRKEMNQEDTYSKFE